MPAPGETIAAWSTRINEATCIFLDMEAKTWKCLRSTNVIERLNRELCRCFFDMGAYRGDGLVTRAASLVAMCLAIYWQGTVVRRSKGVTRKKTLA